MRTLAYFPLPLGMPLGVPMSLVPVYLAKRGADEGQIAAVNSLLARRDRNRPAATRSLAERRRKLEALERSIRR